MRADVRSACLFAAVALTSLLLPAASVAGTLAEASNIYATYTAEFLSNPRGALPRDAAYVDNLDLTLSIDGDALFGWPGAEILVYGLYNNGTPFSETVVGDAQVVSNIETGAEATRLYEAWLRAPLGDDTEMLFGLYDLNREFDVLAASSLFPGSEHGIGTDIAQTGRNGPSIFPVAGLGLRIAHRISDSWSVRGAVLDGVPGDPDDPASSRIRLSGDEGALIVSEFEWSDGASRILAGGWAYTADFSDNPLGFDGVAASSRSGNAGAYLRGETVLLEASPRVSVFGRLGYARGDVNPFQYFASAGVTWQDFWPARDEDEAGLAVAWAETSHHVEDLAASAGSAVDAREVAIELTYRAPINERLVLQPTVHYIINPGIVPARDNAVVLALRFVVTLLD